MIFPPMVRRIWGAVKVGLDPIFTFALVVVAVLQYCTLEKTDQTSRLRDRAFVFFGTPPITPYPAESPIVWGIGVEILNAGNLPARGVSVEYDCPIIYKSQAAVDHPFMAAKWKKPASVSVIGPKSTLVLEGCNIPVGKIFEAKRGETKIFFVSRVVYRDGMFPQERFTEMSRNLSFDEWGGKSWSFVRDGHNCTDDDCEKTRQ